ncbi:hypothetical protein [Roseovarius nanhaiticus]|uniref:hypothetical protein n=1 Tax=Roseovarius nanhaiticus TaxID=573024 RepID=UPI002490CCFB|nr:hypothetical protein [Roseovarius nanhaiticus]
MGSKKVSIETSMSYLAHAIRTRADGDMYRPLFARLNEELTAIIKMEEDLDSVIQEYASAA